MEPKSSRAPRKERKSGWKTSEFQTMALFQFGNICAAISGVVKPEHAALAAAIAQAAYAVSRGIAKSKESDQ